MKVLVPTSVDVKRLVEGLNLSPTRKRNMKYKIYYILSLMVLTNDNYELNEKSGGYRSLSSVLMKKIIGRKDFYFIISLLSNPVDAIIESDNSWHNSTSDGKPGYCKGYRLTDKYNSGDVVYKTLPQKFRKRVLNHVPESPASKEINEKLRFLVDQFDLHSITIDDRVYDFIREFGMRLMERAKNQYQTKMILNLIGRWLYYVEKIRSKDIWVNVSPDNHRLNSSFTNLPAILRPFILCNGRSFAMVDIKSSQPYLLASVMNYEFFTFTGNGFNLYNIYPELYNELVQKKLFEGNVNTTYNGNRFISGSATFPFHSFNYDTGEYYKNEIHTTTTNTSPFMWGQFFYPDEIESINRFQNSSFDNDFYIGLLHTYYSSTGDIDDFYAEERQKIKDTMMYVLFADNIKHRNNDHYMKIFREAYPGVEKWIRAVHKEIDKHRFSYLLQRAESYLVLNVVSREFNSRYPLIPIFTIHDALFTYEEYIPELTKLILERFKDLTGVTVGVKEKNEIRVSGPNPEEIEVEWSEIRKITTPKKYQKVSRGIFSSNIERALIFLNNWPEFSHSTGER